MERYLSVAQASAETGIPKRTLYDAIARGDIATMVPNGCRRGQRIAESEMARWLRDNTGRRAS